MINEVTMNDIRYSEYTYLVNLYIYELLDAARSGARSGSNTKEQIEHATTLYENGKRLEASAALVRAMRATSCVEMLMVLGVASTRLLDAQACDDS